jgi:hypothetical protein
MKFYEIFLEWNARSIDFPPSATYTSTEAASRNKFPSALNLNAFDCDPQGRFQPSHVKEHEREC